MRALLFPQLHTPKVSGVDAAATRRSARVLSQTLPLRVGVARLSALAMACILAGFAPLTAHAGGIQGSVFEDVGYGGGAGRNLATSAGIKEPGVRVELFTSAGGFINGQNTDAVGDFKFNGVSAGDYWLRVVTQTMKSTRSGFTAGLNLAVPTFRTNLSSGSAVDVGNEVGGHAPNQTDAPTAAGGATINVSTFQFTAGPTGYANTLTPVHLATGATQIFGVEFGLAFDVIVNTNPSGAGSFDQFIRNANSMTNAGLAQSGLSAGIEHAIWMISNGTNAPGLRAANNYFTGGVAHIASNAPIAVVSDPVDIDARLQPGFTSRPIVVLDGSAAGAGVNGLELGAPGSSLRGMIIDGYGGKGLVVSATNCVVAGNWIGLTGAGNASLANGGSGISVSADGVTLGGTTAADRNVVSGNLGGGVVVAFTVTAGTLQGNWIGTDATGTGAVPNGGTAALEVDGTNITVGGSAAGAGNVVSGNVGDAVRLSGTGSHVQGNIVGMDPSATFPLGNSGRGVFISPDFGGSGLAVGGVNAGEGNVIAFNGGAGIVLDPLVGEGNLLLRNAIHDNGGVGIDLGSDGVTANDPGDADGGPNSRQNFPVVTFARTTETVLHVQGTLNSDASTPFRVELFASAAADPTGNGEGARYVGTTHLLTDGAGNAAFDTTITVPVTIGEVITATATSLDFSNTSEFSAAFTSTDGNGIIVSPTAGLVTSEAGDSAQFTVVLESQPTSNVTIPLVSTKPGEGQPSPSLLTFTSANWSTPQTVTVNGVNEFRVDGPQTYTIQTQPAISADAHYSGRNAADVDCVNNDDDVAGINVSPVAGLVTTEAGGTATFTVVLNSQPDQDVTIPLSSTNTAEGTVSPSSLTFTSANWSVPRTVTLTGVDDNVVDGNQAYSVITGAASSTDPNYTGRDPSDVTASNTDDDVIGVTISPSAGLVTTESGGIATFTAVLTSMPSADVTFGLSSSNTAEGTVSPASLTFTPGNWNAPQTVTVTGVDDVVIDGPQVYSIRTDPVVSADGLYAGFNPADAIVTNADNDAAGIIANPSAGLVTTEAGGTATFTLSLATQPTGDVTIPISSSNTAEGTITPASVTFTSGNWNVPRTVTLTGVDDAVDDGDVAYSAVLGAATSSDGNYSGLDAPDVGVTNTDNDVAGITVFPTAGLVTTEAGGTALFTVVLTSQPTDDVTIPIISDTPSEGTAGPTPLKFTPGNWNVPQTVIVSGVDDAVDDGDIAYTVRTIAAGSTDPKYGGRNAADVSVTNTDDDVAGFTVSPLAGLVTTEAGGTATFTLRLTSQPLADVTVPIASTDPTEGTAAPLALTFTSADWNVPQTVTVTGVNDAVDDGDQAYSVQTGAASSADPNYAGLDAPDVAATNTDDDVAGITVAPVAGLVTSEAGGTATFTVRLATQPVADVTIPLSSSNTAEGTVLPSSLTFTAGNWNLPQTVTVTGVDDQVKDGDIAYGVQTGAAVSADPNYSGNNAADVSVTNTDDDVAGITVAPVAGLVTSEAGGTATFTVRLTSQPVAGVTVPIVSGNPAEGTALPASLTFTAADWNVPQTVTVTGADDQVMDGDIAYTVQTGAASSSDPNYSGVNPADVSLTNTDNDVAGITVTPTSGLVTTEGGGTASFSVYLTSQPVADVTIPLSSTNTAEGTVAPASLTFTAANWNVAQTVTLTGVNDAVADGNIAYTVVTGAASSTDPHYSGMDPADVSASNSDDDATGITVSPVVGLVTTEAGGTATFTVVLTSQPTAGVTIPIASSNPAEGTAAPASLTFTAANWNVAQTVTVTGVDDAVDDGDVAYTVATGAAVSADPGYNGQNAADVAVTNTDNDAAGITVAPVAGLVTTEAGGTATFTVVLTSQPVADVTVPVASNNPAEGTATPASVTFTPANWNVAQTITVTGVDDNVQDGSIAYAIVTAPAASTDPNYSGRDAADVTVSNSDNDVAGITVAPVAGLVTTEAGGTATFTVVLTSQPVADVTVPVASSNPAEGTAAPASLTFTAGNWNVAQTITVTGVDDQVQDGNVAYTVVTAPAASADPNYNGKDAADVAVSNTDNDVAGITATPLAGLVTTESGGTATFTVRLDTQPVADVTVPLASNNTAEGTVSPASLTFTSANWNVPQTVTVTGVDDNIKDGDIAYSILLNPSTSADPHYSGVDAADVAVTNTDNDVAGITVAPTAGLVTTESGGTATFTVQLNTQPAANVSVALSSSNTAEGTVAPASVTFTSANWNTPQTVTVTGVDDAVQDGDIAYTIVSAAATSTDPNYNGVNPADVAVTNRDNDVSGITVTPTAGLVTTEAGGTATFTIRLDTQPVASVTIPLSSGTAAEGQVFPASLTFTAANWNLPRTVTVRGVDDFVRDGDQPWTAVTGPATSTDPHYSGMNAADVSVTNRDDDVAGVTVTPTAGLVTTEAGGTATFTMRLTSQPVANVAIALSSSNVAEGTVAPASLAFTAANWNVPQTVTVTGVDDPVQDGSIAYTIVTGPSVSTDPNYSGVNPADVSVSNTDNDVAGITVAPTAGLVTDEWGSTATFTVVLNTRPVADVTIPVTTGDATEGAVAPASLTFTAGNWNLPQTVTVTGVDDVLKDGDITYNVVTGAASSSDPHYSGLNPADVSVTNQDNDTPGISVTPVAGLVTTEAGGTATFTLRLSTQPSANVTIPLSSSDVTEGTVSPASVTFTAVNWNVAQTVTVTGVDDFVQDGNIAYTIGTGFAVSTDPDYSGLDAADVAVTNTDNDVAGITVAPVAGLTTSESGGTATFTVRLDTQPVASVTIPLASSNPAEGTVSPASLTFSAANWSVAQTVTVTGVDDQVKDGDIAYSVQTAAAVSTDPVYAGMNAADVAVTNTDNDVAGITVAPVAGLVTTEAGGTATFTVKLVSQPTANVVIPIASSDATEGTAAPASLTFTAANWNTPQTVTVTGVDDAVADGDIAYTVQTGAAVSTDPVYNGMNAADVAVTNTDNDSPSITVTPVAGLVTSEAGGTATFTMVLTSQPVADVTIPVSSGNAGEGSVSPASVTFTAANWNVAQTVTVTGVDDNVVDGTVAYTVITGAAASSDPRYNGQNPADVAASNTDNDTPGILVAPTAGLVTSESGGQATFAITLRSQPVADVVIPVSSSDLTEGTVSPASVTITPAAWNTPHVVTVTGVDDPIIDGNVPYTAVLAPATSSDPVYAGMDAPDVSLTNNDDQDGSSVVLDLVADHDKIQQGQPVGFRLAVRNRTGQPIDDITLTHVLPARFAALKGTMLQDGRAIGDQPGASQTLTIAHLGGFVDRNGDGVAGPGESGYAEFRWQLVPGAGATAGSYTDLVTAVAGCATCVVANPASAVVRVDDNELFTRSTLLGRVFEDRDRNGQQAANEPGIAGAHVVMDDGTWVVTDAQGMFHVPDLEAGPRAVKLDVAGLGGAASPTTDASTVVTIAPGLLASVRFGVAFPRDTLTVGRTGAGGLAVTANDPETILDLSGSATRGSLSLNGVDVPVAPTSRTEPAVAGEHKPAVHLGAIGVPVDKAGRFATSVPNPGSDTLEVALVDARGKVSAARVHLPRLDILAPRGEVRLPFGQASNDVRLASGAAAAATTNDQIASAGDGSGSGPVAWTTVRGRTDPGAAVEINGRKTTVAADGSFTTEIALHVGENTISVLSKDARGLSNLAHVAVQVADHEQDGKPVVAVDANPELSLYLPPKGVALQSPALTVAGRTHAGNRLAINGDSVVVNSDGTFSHRVMLAEGQNHLKVGVLDARGRVSSLERDLEVRSPKMFLVGLADGVIGRSTGAAFLAPGQNTKDTWNEARLAWNLRGWVAGRYLVTSAFDSRRRDFQSLFKNLDDAGRDRLLTNLDPDKLYPVFGDSGSVQNSSLSGGRLYVGVQGDAVRASLGNFPIALNDVELAGFHRTLYGAQMQFGKAAGGPLPSGTAVSVFGAQASHVHVHDELDATGGTLYYLSHNEVLQGSAQVSLVVRDRITGLLLARVPQQPGIDVIVKEFEGRVQFARPIASVWDDGSVIGSGRLQGHPVSIEVDYETNGHGDEKTAAGGRITQQVGDKLLLGGTVVDDQSGNGNYRLRGSDFTLNVAKGTRLLGEVATSNGTTGRAFRSIDGGLGWAEADSANERSGMAWKTAAEIDLHELLHTSGAATLTGYVRRVDSGFLSDGEREGIALDREGVRGQMSAGQLGLLSARFDRETRPEAQFNTLSRMDLFGMQWRKDGARTGAAAEFEQRNLQHELAAEDRNATGAMRLWWKPVDRLKTTVEHQQTFDGEKASASALGLEWRALKSLSLEARGSTGDQGKTLRGGATMSVGARQFYVREEQTLADRGVTGGTMFGMQAPLGPESRVYSEYQWQRDPAGDHGVSVTGIEQGWHTASGLAMQVAGEHGTGGSGAQGQHGTIAGTLSYKGRSPLSGSTRAEARRMQGAAYSRQMLTATRLELALPSGFTVLSDLRMSMTRHRLNSDNYTTPNRYTESSVGLSWRAPRSDAVQALGRWTRLEDRHGASPGDPLGTQSVLGVAALEATVRVLPGVEWAMKGATRLDQSGSAGLPLGTAHSTLYASRLDYKLGQQPLRLGVEYRRLEQREAADNRGGWLNELSIDPGQHMRFGVGYNFSRFSGDPLVRNQDSAQGWFIRAQSRY